MEYCDCNSNKDQFSKKRAIQKNIGTLRGKNYHKDKPQTILNKFLMKFIHGDLKLRSIMRNQGILKLCDLGLTKKKDGSIDPARGTLGTIAPEIIEKKPFGIQADMFSLGVIFYQLLFGELPFSNQSKDIFLKEVKNNILSFGDANLITVQAKDLIQKMLKYDPNERISFEQIYDHTLFEQKMPVKCQILQTYSFIDDHNVNMDENNRYYKTRTAEDAISYNSVKNPQRQQQTQTLDSQTIIEQISQKELEIPIDDDKLKQTRKIQQENEKIQKEIHRAFQLYVTKTDSLVFLSRVIDQIQKHKHSDDSNPYLPVFILVKKLNILYEDSRNKINQRKNIFDCKYIEQLYEYPNFKSLIQKLDMDIDIIKTHFKVTVNQLWKMLNKLPPESRNSELIGEFIFEPTVNFNKIYQQILFNYIGELQDEIQNLNRMETQKIGLKLNLILYVLDCLRLDPIFQDEVSCNQIIKKQKIKLLNINLNYYFQIFDKYSNQDKEKLIEQKTKLLTE